MSARQKLLRGVVVVSSLCFSPSAFSQTTQPILSASLGFGGVFKPDAWVPIYVRLADTAARPATLEVRTARGRLGHSIAARIATNVPPTTYTLYAPLGTLDQASLQLRDARGRLVRSLDLSDQVQQTPAALGGPAIGVSSPVDAVAQRVATQLVRDSGEYVAAGVLSTRLLPERAVGYACLDVLVLPELDTDLLDDGVEAAIVAWVRSGGIVVAWPGAQPATLESRLRTALPTIAGPGVADLSDGEGSTFRRRLGLGQIVRVDFDPSRTPAIDRMALWRRLTEGQVSLSPDDRRAGVFDPLVRQAVAEQALDVPSARGDWTRTLLLAAVGLGLVAGPGEALMLLLARRSIGTWYTRSGTALLVLSFGLYAWPQGARGPVGTSIEIRVESDDGTVALASLATRPPSDAGQATWLTGDRLDTTNRPAAELRLGQRESGFLPTDAGALSLGGEPAKLREICYGLAETENGVQWTPDPAAFSNATEESWNAIAIVEPLTVRLQAGAVLPGATVACVVPSLPADLPATRRVETGIERLAGTPGWEPLMLDRALAERFVRLQETERATLIVARGNSASGTRFVVRVSRPD